MRSLSIPLALLVLAVGFTTTAHAQTDYYTALEQELSDTYGLTGGTWLFAADETTMLDEVVSTFGVTTTTEDVTGQPFTKALRVGNANRGANPWDHKIELYNDAAIAVGETALLIIWVRNVFSEIGGGFINIQFEQAGTPFDKSLDDGLLPSTEWQRLIIPWTAQDPFAIGQGRFQITFGNLWQTFEVGGVAMRYYGTAYTQDQLPRTDHNDNYAGRDLAAAWRADADARIEEHRKADLTVRVEDGDGTAVPDVAVDVAMQQHAFGFGTAVAVERLQGNGTDSDWYREKLENLNGDGKTFSMVVLENALKWGTWENPFFEGTPEEVAEAVQWFRERDITVRGHTLVWPGWQFLPSDIQANQSNPDYINTRIEDHLNDILTFPGIQGEIVDWDVLNEPTHEQDLEGVLGGPSVYAEWFKMAEELAPEANLYINEYSLLSSSGLDVVTQANYKAVIEQIIADGGRLDGIGLQGHVGLPFAPPVAVYDLFDDFAVYGAQLAVTEYDAANIDEVLAADYLRDILTISFSHPAVERFLIWGFWDNNHWFGDAPIYRGDKTIKPSGEEFLRLVFEEWWTDAALTADASGEAQMRGFKGTYRLQADAEGFEVADVTAQMLSDTTFTLTLAAVGTVVPPAPGTLTATLNDTEDAVVLTWMDHSKGETGFVIERQTGDGDFAPIDTVGADVTTFTDAGVAIGTYTYRVYATNAVGDSDPTGTAEVLVTQGGVSATYGNGGTPGSGEPWLIQQDGLIRIEAEDFNQGGPGIGYSDFDSINNGGEYRSEEVDVEASTDLGGGFNVGWIEPDEWLNYTVEVEAADRYDLRLRVAREPTGLGQLRVWMGPDVNSLQDVSGTVDVPSTGGWQSWTTVTVPAVELEAGVQVMRLEMLATLFNLNWIEVDGASVTSTEDDVPVAYGLQPIYPNPFRQAATVQFVVEATQRVQVVAYDLLGRRLQTLHDGLALGGQRYTTRLDGVGLASGLYVVRLEGETTTASQQVLRVR